MDRHQGNETIKKKSEVTGEHLILEEAQFPPKAPKRSDKTLWKVTASQTNPEYPVENIIDGKDSTTWQSNDADEPQWVIWDLGQLQTINGIQVDFSSHKTTYDLLTSVDANEWKIAGTREEASDSCIHAFSTNARYIKIDCKKISTGRFSIFEVRLLENVQSSASKRVNPGEDTAHLIATASNESLWKATASRSTTNSPVANILDGDSATKWCSGDTNRTEWVLWDLGQLQEINGVQVELTKRKTTYDLLTSRDGEVWELVASQKNGKGLCIHRFSSIGRYIKVLCKEVITDRFYILEMSLLEKESVTEAVEDELQSHSVIKADQGTSIPAEIPIE